MTLALPILSRKPKTKLIAYASVVISWMRPKNSLNETTWYNVECYLCYTNKSICNTSCMNEIYHPRAKALTQTEVAVSNLTVGGRYVFRVYPINSLNGQVPGDQWYYSETYPVQVPSGKNLQQIIVNHSAEKSMFNQPFHITN